MMEYDLIGNAMDSLNEAIDYYKSGKEYKDGSRFKYCVLLLAHSAELILKEILFNESEYLLYENIDDIDESNPLTIGFRQSLLRVKKICRINLGKYENYLIELVNIRNQIQHYRFKISQEYCDKIIVRSFSAIEYIVIEILSKTFNDFGDYISSDQIEYLHEDKDVYNNRKQDIAKDIIDNGLKKCNIEYATNKFIYIPCPVCSETTLINTDSIILCKFCGNKFDSIKLVYEDDYNGIIQAHMLREIGRKKDYFNSAVFECKNCNYDAMILTDKWQCLVCGYEFQGTIYCEDCGEEIPDSPYNYVFAQSYYDSDNYMFLCKECGKKLYESEIGVEYEIQ
ncbi:MAG TPA: hypothetical protein GX527_08205 [Clostridiaceae bacterium]|nr:hypothetical protein [Clostridiaceae bacterium]